MMQKVSELKEPPVIGKFYLVECVKFRDKWVPVVGDLHRDPEIGVSVTHWHRDLRFDDFSTVSLHVDFGYEGTAFAQIISDPPFIYEDLRARRLLKRKCRRAMPIFPHKHPTKGTDLNTRKLEPLFEGRKVLCGKCPHRGMPLESLPKDERGHVVCNGHGLKIDMNRGEVVSR